MKWYFAINEAGTKDQLGMHAKIAVISAMKYNNIRPNLVYYGNRNDFTKWMEQHDVNVIDYEPTFSDYIKKLHSSGLYSIDYMGHWLRAGICNIEDEDDIVIYTDCDIIFLQQPNIECLRPTSFACAPEFKIDGWNYFNSGVMVMNVRYLRKTYSDVEIFIKEALLEMGVKIRDQYAYNMFYKSVWEKLDPAMNWKPYWGPNANASILHFHGPKLGAIFAILDGKWNWLDEPGIQIGSLFTGNLSNYIHSLQSTLDAMGSELPVARTRIEQALEQISTFRPTQKPELGFTEFRLFAE